MATKNSAISDEPVDVLFCLHPKFDLLDFAGPLEAFTTASHDFKDAGKILLLAILPSLQCASSC